MARLLSGKQVDKVLDKYPVQREVKWNETTTQVIKQLEEAGYADIKVYDVTTAVRGYYRTYVVARYITLRKTMAERGI